MKESQIFGICPWDQFSLAHHQFCEETLCAWIRHPADAFSNIAFLIYGYFIYRTCQRLGLKSLKAFGHIGIALGLTSMIFHASGTFFFEVFDFAAMYAFNSYLLLLNWQRRFEISKVSFNRWFWGMTLFSALVLIFFKWVGGILFAGQIIMILFLEWKLNRLATNANRPKYGSYILALISMFMAFIIWNLDKSKILCWPENHLFTGHSAWHVLCATSYFYMFRFYTQFFLDQRTKS
jgi:hypothetical protein